MADIYPILGSLLGVDPNNSNEQTPNKSNNDLYETFGYLTNNNNTTIVATNNSTTSKATTNTATNPIAGGRNATGREIAHSLLINALSGATAGRSGATTSILERDDYMQCKHCKRFYKSMQKLQEHVRKYCLKEKKYKCVSCEYRSRRKDHVLRHAKRKHCELYEQFREEEESLFVIRTEEESDDHLGRYDVDMDYDGPNDDYLIPTVSMGIGSGSCSIVDGGGIGTSVAASTMQAMGFKFGSRDLTITAVPVLQESEEDDDDYDDDGE